jgi:hypothetical protein
LPPAQNCFAFVPAAVRLSEPAQKQGVKSGGWANRQVPTAKFAVRGEAGIPPKGGHS